MTPTRLRSALVVAPRLPSPDAALLAAFAAGRDEGAFAELVRRHARLVRGAARRVLGDPAGADDVAQQAFLTLARKAGGRGWGPTVGPWLYRVTLRLAVRAKARAARRPAALSGDVAAPSADPAAGLTWAEARAALDDGLARLPEHLRAPLVLCYLQGLTRDEAAAALGCSPDALKGRLERGRARLREYLSDRGLSLAAALAGVAADAGGRAAFAAATARAAVGLPASGAVAAGWAWATAAAVVLVAGACVAGLPAGPTTAPPTETPPPRAAGEQPTPRVDRLGDLLPPGAVARLGSNRFRVGMWPIHLAPSPDGSQVAVIAWEHGPTQFLMILDAATGRTVREVPIRGGWVQWLRWRPDGRGFLLAKVDVSEYVLWEFTDPTAPPPVGDPQKVPHNKGPRSFQNSIPSPDGTRLAADTGRRVAVWPLGKPGPAAVGDPAWAAALPAEVVALHFTPDGKRLVGVTGGPGKPAPVKVWDAATGKELAGFDVPLGHGRAVALSADGTALFAADAEGRVAVVDLATGRVGRTFDARHETATGPYEDINRLVPTADGRTLLVFRYGHGADAFDPATGKPRWRVRDLGYPYHQSVGLMPDGKRFLIGGTFGRIAVGDLATGRVADDPDGLDHVGAVAVAADGRTATTTGNDRAVRRWDLGTGRELGRVALPPELGGLSLSPDGRRAVGLGGPTGRWERAALLDATTGRGVADLPVDAAQLGSLAGSGGPIAWLPNGSVVIAGGKHPSRRFARDGAVVTTYAQEGPAANRHMWAAAASPDGRTVVLASHDRGQGPACAAVYDAATGKQLRAWDPGVQFTGAAFAPDGRSVVLTGDPNMWAGRGAAPGGRAATPDEAVILVDLAGGTGPVSFALPPGLTNRSTTAPVVSPTGYQVAVAEADHSLTVYELASGAIRRRLRGHRNDVNQLAFTPDGRRLVSVSADGTGLVWETGPPAPTGPVSTAEPDRRKRWEALGSADPPTAEKARGEWAADPAGLVAVADRLLKPAPPPTDAEVDALVDRLGADDFADREAATKALDRFGPAALPRAKDRLPGVASPEARRRLADFLTRTDRPADRLTGVRLHERRAVEALEAAGTAEAKAVLKALADGDPSSGLTREAKAALARLGADRP